MLKESDTEMSEMQGRLPNSKTNFYNEETDEIHIDKFVNDNFIYERSQKNCIHINSYQEQSLVHPIKIKGQEYEYISQ